MEIASFLSKMPNYITKTEFKLLFGKRLELLRSERKLSLRTLAQRCDIDHSDIAKIEKGKIDIQIGTVMELAKGLNVHPRDLFDFEFEVFKE